MLLLQEWSAESWPSLLVRMLPTCDPVVMCFDGSGLLAGWDCPKLHKATPRSCCQLCAAGGELARPNWPLIPKFTALHSHKVLIRPPAGMPRGLLMNPGC